MAQYKIGHDLVLNTHSRKLTRGENELALPELSYRLLTCLVEHAPNVVPHQVLHQQVWQGKVVSDDTIKKRVSRVRETLAVADAIIAERGLGYRLNLTVIHLKNQVDSLSDSSNQASTISHKSAKPLLLILIAAIFTTLVILGVFNSNSAHILLNNEPNKLSIQNQSSQQQKQLTKINQLQAADYRDLHQRDDINNAIKELETRLLIQPNDPILLNLLSELHQTRFRLYQADLTTLDTALKYAQQSVKNNPNQAWSHITLANAYSLYGDLTNAQTHIQSAIALSPNWVDVFVMQARVYRLKGDTKRAWQRISFAYQSHPENPKVRLERAKILISKNMFNWAKSTLLELKQAQFNEPAVKLALTEFYITTEEYPASLELLNELTLSYPNAYKVNFLLGVVYDVQGKIEHARTHYQSVAQSQSIYRQTAQLLLTLTNTEEYQPNYKELALVNTTEKTQTPLDAFNIALYHLANNNNDAFFASLERAIANQFATEYLLHLSSIDDMLLAQAEDKLATNKRWQTLKQQLHQINQNKRVKRTPIKTQ